MQIHTITSQREEIERKKERETKFLNRGWGVSYAAFLSTAGVGLGRQYTVEEKEFQSTLLLLERWRNGLTSDGRRIITNHQALIHRKIHGVDIGHHTGAWC